MRSKGRARGVEKEMPWYIESGPQSENFPGMLRRRIQQAQQTTERYPSFPLTTHGTSGCSCFAQRSLAVRLLDPRISGCCFWLPQSQEQDSFRYWIRQPPSYGDVVVTNTTSDAKRRPKIRGCLQQKQILSNQDPQVAT